MGRGILRHTYSKILIDLLFLPDSLRHKKNFRVIELMRKYLAETVEFEGIQFDASDRGSWARGELIKEKEPDTLQWLDRYVQPGDVLYDIGANIGVFTLYAAIKRKAVVRAFEPESMNYCLLNKNIFYNQLSESVLAFNLALHDSNAVSILNLPRFKAGGGTNAFEQPTDAYGQDFKPVFKQGAIGMPLDYFVEHYKQLSPNHIKIDVDGHESSVIAGMQSILRRKELRSLAIEINEVSEADLKFIRQLETVGFQRLHELESYADTRHQGKNLKNLFFLRDNT